MRHRPLAPVLVAALSLLVAVGCSGASLSERFDELPVSPDAESYEGDLEAQLDSQMLAIVAGSGSALGGTRVELLPATATLSSHIAWRTDHVGDRRVRPSGATDPDPRRTTFVGDDDSVVIIARELPDGRLVVMTALLGDD